MNSTNPKRTRFPCKNSLNLKIIIFSEVHNHLIVNGISKIYIEFILHKEEPSKFGEYVSNTCSITYEGPIIDDVEDGIIGMINFAWRLHDVTGS